MQNLKLRIKKKLKEDSFIRNILNKTMESKKQIMQGIFSKGSFLPNLYYFVNNSFSLEHQKILKGKAKYYNSSGEGGGSNYLLRRNIHRIEKGLSMKERKSLFAVDYILETVKAYGSSLKKKGHDRDELAWARDVLEQYFRSIDLSKKTVNKAYQLFKNYSNTTRNYTERIPFERTLAKQVDYDSLLSLAKHRKSIRWFSQKKVSREIIDKSLDSARFSPSACNRQPMRFEIYENQNDILKISSLAGGTTGYRKNIPTLVVVIGDFSAYFNERDRHLLYIDTGLSAMNFALALETFGVGSCLVNWPNINKNEKKITKLLNLKPWEQVIMLVAVGYPNKKGKVCYSEKKNINNFRQYRKLGDMHEK
ncbi:MAG: nitroreductase family protein [Nanoarchaeota archaeon]